MEEQKKETFLVDDLKKFLKGKDHFIVIPFPGTFDKMLSIRMLTQTEIDLAHAQAEENLSKRYGLVDDKGVSTGKSKPVGDMARLHELQRQLIWRFAIQEPTPSQKEIAQYSKFFESPEQVGDILHVDHIEVLMQHYNDFQERYSPVRSLKKYSDFEKLIDDIKKKSIGSLSLNTFELSGLVDFMVKNPEILQKDSGMSHTLLSKSEQNKNKKKLKTQEKKEKEGEIRRKLA